MRKQNFEIFNDHEIKKNISLYTYKKINNKEYKIKANKYL